MTELLLTLEDLKTWLPRKLPQTDKLLLVLASLEAPSQISDIRDRALMAGLRIPRSWNVSARLGHPNGYAINTPAGWEITAIGRKRLRCRGVTKLSTAAVQIAFDLRAQLDNIKDADTRLFVEEAIGCHEAGFYRSAVVMSWLAAVDMMQKYFSRTALMTSTWNQKE